MEVTAQVRFLRMAPRKVRLVADLVRGRRVGEALTILDGTPKAAARPVRALLKSAVANAAQTKKIDVDTLRVKAIAVGPGPVLKRLMPRAMGRAAHIRHRMSHVAVILEET